ncbi:hypothetical protein [Halogeometricum sp. CBA1124]|uniref:hypothetical protein n=1 Tax=Halogeometricum sp. CBA1124 TaxID=2668071 RepID=UPI00142ABDED|nr:hypothetical protein [Halogeometricum sp. CBA1124]MUV56505.1 hypothetical protein [Halogeometricum sp. CBA1124]
MPPDAVAVLDADGAVEEGDVAVGGLGGVRPERRTLVRREAPTEYRRVRAERSRRAGESLGNAAVVPGAKSTGSGGTTA